MTTSENAGYAKFLHGKQHSAGLAGLPCDPSDLHQSLFPFQRHVTRWAVEQGRAAVWATTGMGKTRMQLEWARVSADRALIVAPLAVCQQTVREARNGLGLTAAYARDDSEAPGPGLWITNYERVEAFDPAGFGAVALDEASILKQSDGKTRTRLIRHFTPVPRRSTWTATPAPNDPEELTNQAEFLGVMPRNEMLAAYFVHDDTGWRLKGHARRPMFRWMATWAVAFRRPSDLGFSDHGFRLPPLTITPELVHVDLDGGDALFPSLGGVGGRAKVRRETLDARCERAATLVCDEPDEQWIAWCGLNAEADWLVAAIPDAVNVHGSLTPEEKAQAFLDFADGNARVIVTKPSIAAFGLNWQNAARQVYVGLSDSYETYFQGIRRSWRFGQKRPVRVHIVLSEPESQIAANVRRKEQEAERVTEELVTEMRDAGQTRHAVEADSGYITNDAEGRDWRLMLGDSCERLAEIPGGSVHLSVYSPPFASLYTYSPSLRDLGNSGDRAEFFQHYRWIIEHNLRVTMPGRNAAVHVQQVATTKASHGVVRLTDFRGEVIRAYEAAGWLYVREVTIDKDPQAQAIRTKAHALMFATKNRDSADSWPALADYLLIFQKPGDNPVPVKTDVSNDEWILWARPVWYDIRETDTLNVAEGREEADERHIAPLQLSLIERAVRLWSNPGETVLSPFAGIGSEGYVAVKRGRRFVGCELKPSYWRAAVRNLTAAEQQRDLPSLWDSLDEEPDG